MNIISSIGRSDPPIFVGGGRTRTLEVRRSARARRMRLAVDPRDGAVRLTLPARASLREAHRWGESKRAWMEQALAAPPTASGIAAGSMLPFAGESLRIVWEAGRPRGVRREGGSLHVGGPEAHLAARVLRWLRAQALTVLEAETRAIAAEAGVSVAAVRVGDPRSRWGSCSSSGDIRYSWRLILAPPEVRRATVAHEVAHRLHMHHGPAFHAEVARLFGRDPAPERAWLRAHGADLWAVQG